MIQDQTSRSEQAANSHMFKRVIEQHNERGHIINDKKSYTIGTW